MTDPPARTSNDAAPESMSAAAHLSLSPLERRQVAQFEDADRPHELRRLVAEFVGTFLVVLVAGGGPVIDALTGGQVGHASEAIAPGLMVMAAILFLGANSGAHLNPVVSLAFAIRSDFRWRRMPGYIVAQVLGAVAAAGTLWSVFPHATAAVTAVGHGFTPLEGLLTEVLLTFGLVSVVLGAASGAQNIGPLSAIAAGGYVAVAGLWAGPVAGASMNPARSLGPALVSGDYLNLWIYFVGPVVGSLLACALAWVLRGRGGDPVSSLAASGTP